MSKFVFFKMDGTLDTDRLNKNFNDIAYDINDSQNRLKYLKNLYLTQLSNVNIINNFRAQLTSIIDATDSATSYFDEDSITMNFIDINTADSYTLSDTTSSYGNVVLSSDTTFDRFPTSIDKYGINRPMYDSVDIYKDSTLLQKSDPAYNMVADDRRLMYIHDTGLETEASYQISSIVNMPIINSIIIEPAFPGLMSINKLQYGHGEVESGWYDIGNFSNMYPQEIIFHQNNNASGIKFIAQSVNIGLNKYVGFYKVGAYYKIFKETGYMQLIKDFGEPKTVKKLELIYNFFNTAAHASVNLFRNLFRIRIYDDTVLVYDTSTDIYPFTTNQTPLDISTGILRARITMNRYTEISPIFKYMLVGV